MKAAVPDRERLETELSRPSGADVDLLRHLRGDLLILGVAGKMGPTLAMLASRAGRRGGTTRRIIGVSRFSDRAVRQRLEASGVQTVRADLLSRRDVDGLPNASNVVFMAGQKFGTEGNPAATWAANAYMPALVAQRFAGSRIVAFSSGNVYPFTSPKGPGPTETDPVGPVGEYAHSVLARERLLEHFSGRNGTPMAILRLNYAVEPRYGVLRDIADRVLSRRPVDLAMGHVNVIWQRDANSVALRLLAHCSVPPLVLNVTGTRHLPVRWLAERFGQALGISPRFRSRESATALLSNASLCRSLVGGEFMEIEEMIDRVARWVQAGGSGLGKPTHFERRDGSF